MSYFVYAKWNLFCIYKRRFLNTHFVKKVNPSFAKVLWFLFLIIQLLVSYSVASSIFTMSDMDLLRIKSFNIGKILNNVQLVQFIFAIYIFVTSTMISVQVGIFVLTDKDEEWLSANYGLEHSRLKLIKIVNYVIYNSKELIIFVLPIAIVCLKHWETLDTQHFFNLMILLIIVVETRILGAILFCVYKAIIRSQNKRKVAVITFMRNIALFILALYIGTNFSEWIDKFPIVHKVVDGKVVELWLDDGAKIVFDLFRQYEEAFIVGSKYFVEFILLSFLSIQVIMLLCCKLFIGTERKHENYNGGRQLLLRHLCKNDMYLKAVLFNKNRIYNINYLLESIMFWTVTGFFSGVMMQIHQEKMLYFLCTSCALYFSVFMASANFRKNILIYALDGEGKKVNYWLGNIPKLYFKKLKIWTINMTCVSLCEYALLYICLRRWELTLFCVIQIVYCIFLFFILSIPGIMFPYYGYSNISELEEYADRKKVSEIIEPILVIGLNSLIVIPVAMYISEHIGYETYVIVQFIVIPILMYITMGIMIGGINKIIDGKEYLDKIYKR